MAGWPGALVATPALSLNAFTRNSAEQPGVFGKQFLACKSTLISSTSKGFGKRSSKPLDEFSQQNACACYHHCVTVRGRFITFEGLDGSGKTTQIEKLAATLRDQRIRVHLTREPGGTVFGETIRHLILDSATSKLSANTELALMFAARTQHLDEVILPALEAGDYVLCDRFTDSTEAYQGGGRQLGSKSVLVLHRVLCADLQPDLTILLDCDLNFSLNRARHRNLVTSAAGHRDENRFEQEDPDFFARVHNKFHEIAEREPKRVAVIDARDTPEETHQKILATIQERLQILLSR